MNGVNNNLWMPKEVLAGPLARYLSASDWASMGCTCRRLREVFEAMLNNELIPFIFDKECWLKVPGVKSVSDVKLTLWQKAWIIDELHKRCKFFNEPDAIQAHRFQNDTVKQTMQTSKVIMIPEKINDQPYDIMTLAKLFSFMKTENTENMPGTVFRHAEDYPDAPYLTEKATRGFWGLFTCDVIPGSRGTTHDKKEELLKPTGSRVQSPRETVISQLIMNLVPAQEKKGFYFGQEGGDWWTYSATNKPYMSGRLVVGGWSPSGLYVFNSLYDGHALVGVAAVTEVP